MKSDLTKLAAFRKLIKAGSPLKELDHATVRH
jgi:hypothetical protein